MSTIRFVNLHATSFAGINKETKANLAYPVPLTPDRLEKVNEQNGIVIYFPENYPYVELEGDQGVGKTSLLNAIIECGGGEAPKNAINSDDKDKKVQYSFWGKDGKLYEASITKSGVVLYQVETKDGEIVLNQKDKPTRMEVRGPKGKLAEVLGPVGRNPLEIATYDAPKQVEWIRGLFKLSEEAVKLEVSLTKEIDTAYKSRTTAGQQLEAKKSALKQNEFFNDREKWIKYFKETSFDNLEKENAEITAENAEYLKAETGIKNLKEFNLGQAEREVYYAEQEVVEANKIIEDYKKKILELEAMLPLLNETVEKQKKAVESVKKRIKDGEQWITDHEDVPVKYANITKRIQEKSDYDNRKKEYDKMLAMENEQNHFEDEKIRLTHIVDAKREAKRTLIKEMLPAIPDLEICTPDEEDKREGIFYKKKPLNHLAESEQWEWFAMLCKVANIQIIVVENISSLGSGTIEKFNEYAANGAYIFASVMNRKESNLTISFNTKIS